MISQVIEFNRDVLGIAQRPVGLLEFNEVSHLIKCLLEETEEFKQAYEYGDYIGLVDALCDNIYFSLGGLYKLGLDAETVTEIFSAIHNCNMTKKKGVVASRDTGAPDAIKPDGWVPPEQRIAEILDRRANGAAP